MEVNVKAACRAMAVAVLLLSANGLGAFAVAASEPDEAGETTVRVVVDGRGFSPATVKAKAGLVTVVFRRTVDVACANEVVFPARKLRRALPLNQDVSVRLTVKEKETMSFTCGMGMLKGKIVAVESTARES
ncbi:MAG: cupredoxin domain-containing protein [Myxococcales bacterium]|nr:cupredoxin domain-containing protein [Myxococcales bacterium]